MKTKKQKLLPRQPLPETIEYHRQPTPSEIRFGYGALHYRDFEKEDYLKKDGTIKKRIKAKDDGLIYTR